MTRRLPIALAALAALVGIAPPATAQQADIATAYRATADSLIRAATGDSAAYRRLGRMVDTFGHRISGSASLEATISWILDLMKADGLENVHGQPVMVPHWVRGEESAELIKPRRTRLAMLGLGGSIGTPARGITAPVLVVGSLDELQQRGADAKGKIVLLDVPFTDYVATRKVRTDGPSAAARVGAVACLIRSVASNSIRSPHTGQTRYDSTVARIPAAALSVEDAMMLHRFQDRGEPMVLTLRMGARMLPDAPSRNVIAEIVGREKPDEVVVVGGHIDSWDVGQGAMDDGGGAVGAWEAVRLMKRLNLRPRRTVRVVLWTAEENGGAGGLAYAASQAGQYGKHVLAIESDNGVFNPKGVVLAASDSTAAIVQQVAGLLQPVNATGVQRVPESPAADITPLSEQGVPTMELDVDSSRYFWYHHSEGDMLDKLDPAEMARCVAVMAVMAYVVADLPEPLQHTTN
jgi:carboxypeptidase Q